MGPKRPSEDANPDAPASKRPRSEAAAVPPPAGAPPPPPRPAVSLAALEKAKKALQLQAALKAKLSKLPTVSVCVRVCGGGGANRNGGLLLHPPRPCARVLRLCGGAGGVCVCVCVCVGCGEDTDSPSPLPSHQTGADPRLRPPAPTPQAAATTPTTSSRDLNTLASTPAQRLVLHRPLPAPPRRAVRRPPPPRPRPRLCGGGHLHRGRGSRPWWRRGHDSACCIGGSRAAAPAAAAPRARARPHPPRRVVGRQTVG